MTLTLSLEVRIMKRTASMLLMDAHMSKGRVRHWIRQLGGSYNRTQGNNMNSLTIQLEDLFRTNLDALNEAQLRGLLADLKLKPHKHASMSELRNELRQFM